MASTLKDLLQRFTFWAAGGALVAVLVLASLAGQAATRTLERLADERGAEVAARAAAQVANYVRERHGEADQLAANPSVIRAAIEAARSVTARQLDKVAPPELERMFAARRQLGADPDLARYVRSYPERSEFTDLTVTESHGLVVLASGVPARVQQRDDPLWRQAMRDGAAESEPAIDSATRSVTVRYAAALRPAGRRARGRLPTGPRRVAARGDRARRQRLPPARGQAREPALRPAADRAARSPAGQGALQSGSARASHPPDGPRPGAHRVRAGGAGALPGKRGVLLGAVSRAQRRRVRHCPDRAAIRVARGRRLVHVRPADDAVAGALAQRTRRGAGAQRGRRRRPRRERGPDRRGRRGRDRRPGARRAVVVRADDGRGAAPPRGRHPLGGRRGGGDGDGDLGVNRADERVDRGDVGHMPGPHQARGGAGAAGARSGGRRGQDPADRHGAGLGRR